MNRISNILSTLQQQQGTEYPVASQRLDNNIVVIDVPIVISENNGVYQWVYITIPKFKYHYRELIDTIISLKYDLSETLAVLFNHLDEPDNEKYTQEYNDFMSWRKFAKEYVKKHFEYKNLV